MIGQTLSHYKVTEKLGEGGMGAVYRALDLHLDRTVAIKVLRTEATADPERKKRFIREAKAASALNHPNIVTVHDIDAASGIDFIAMEYVDGKTLGDCIGRKGVAVGEALKYAVQIAEALAAAHAAGIVHRDLKPANIMVARPASGRPGLVKVLDFGLAKLTEVESEELAATHTLEAVEAPRTGEGTIVGTVAYMSPEQAEGKKVDARSDIFSFGAVLYEMITSQRPFQGDTKMATLSAVLSKEPRPISDIVERVPRELDRIVTRCLRKDPDRRFQHMEDLKVALQELKEESESGTLARGQASELALGSRGRLPFWLAAAAGVVLLAAGAGVAWWLLRPRPAPPASAFTRLTSDSGLSYQPALSPDGKLLAYASDRSGEGNLDIWVKQVAGGEPVRLTRHEAQDSQPSFSPDSTKIAFRSEREGGGIYVVSALGGEERKIVEHGRAPRFSPDGRWISYDVTFTAVFRGHIYVLPSTGGEPRQLSQEFNRALSPIWSPDGKHLLFVGSRESTEQSDWWVTPFEGGPAVKTGAMDVLRRHQLSFATPSIWLAEGNHIVFSASLGDSTNIWQVSISPRSWQVTGTPQRLTSGTGVEMFPSMAPGPDGRPILSFSNVVYNVDLWSLPVDANRGKVTGEPRRLTRDAAVDHSPSVSADGRKAAFLSLRSGNSDVWLKDLESGRETAVTITGSNESWPIIASDASKVAYAVVENRKVAVYVAPAGGGTVQKLCEDCGEIAGWSSDGRKILYLGVGPSRSVSLLNVASGEKVELLKHSEHALYSPRFSPDNRWITFQELTGLTTRRLWIVPYRGEVLHPEADWIPANDGAALDREPRWSPDGNLFYFLSDRDGFRCIWAQRLEPGSKHTKASPFAVQHFHGALNMMPFRDVGAIGLAVAGDKLVVSLAESTGNIWMAKLTGQ